MPRAESGGLVVEEPLPGIVLAWDRSGGWFLSNSLIADLGGVTLVVDTQYNEERARHLQGLIESRGLPGRVIIVNTHHHGDHAWGNHVFEERGAVAIMRREAWRQAEPLLGTAPGIYEPLFPWLDFRGSRYTRPLVQPEAPGIGEPREVLRLEGEARRARLVAVPPAHTLGDLIVVVEPDMVVAAGDLLFNRVTPLAIDGTVAGWLRALDQARPILEGARLVLPGHGPPLSGGEAAALAGELGAYMRWLLDAARAALESGIEDPIEALRAAGEPPLGWSEPERHPLNLDRAMMDLQGRPPGEPSPRLPGLAARLLAGGTG